MSTVTVAHVLEAIGRLRSWLELERLKLRTDRERDRDRTLAHLLDVIDPTADPPTGITRRRYAYPVDPTDDPADTLDRLIFETEHVDGVPLEHALQGWATPDHDGHGTRYVIGVAILIPDVIYRPNVPADDDPLTFVDHVEQL